MYTFINNLINLGFLVLMLSGAWLWTATCYTLLNVMLSEQVQGDYTTCVPGQ